MTSSGDREAVNSLPEKRPLGPVAIRYAIVGVLNTVIHFLGTAFCVELYLLSPVPASIVGFALAVVVSFVLNRNWTFSIKDRSLERLARFSLVSVVGLLLNTLIMYFSVEILQVHYFFGLLFVLVVVPPSNFFLNLFWSFRSS